VNNDFDSSIVTDFVPHGSLCEWCQKPTVQQLTVIGGIFHNESGFFCSFCGEKFACTVTASPRDAVATEAGTNEQAFR
jgi:hypothetical protein